MEKETNFHQQLMNEAYDVWNRNKGLSTEMYFNILSYKHKLAVSLGQLNYQVENGGFIQWRVNGYEKDHFDFLHSISKKLDAKNYPALKKALELMVKFHLLEEPKREYDEDEEEYQMIYNEYCKEENPLCTQYYDLIGLSEDMDDFIIEESQKTDY